MSENEPLEKTIRGAILSRISRTSGCLIDSKLEPLGLKAGQLPYIMTIVGNEGLTQDELSTHIRVCPAATARTLKNMEDAGLIRREENPANRRQKLVYPTEQAKKLKQKLHPILEYHNSVMVRGFSEEEKKQVLALLKRMAINVEEELSGDKD